jgi:hypothetical protein
VISHGQVDGRTRRAPTSTTQEDHWAEVVAETAFWEWLSDHASTVAASSVGAGRGALEAVALAAAQVAYVSAHGVEQAS